MNESHSNETEDQTAAFQRIWTETMSKMMQAAFTFTPNSPPPEVMRQIRSGIFQALSESWDQFMRSPQFLEAMKQWMENAVTFRKMTNDLLGKVRNEMQAPSREDIDTIMLAVRHAEKRLLDRLDQLSATVGELQGGPGARQRGTRRAAGNGHRAKRSVKPGRMAP